MSFNILDAVKGHFTSELVGKAASFLGESESGVGKAVNSLLPTVLSGITSHAGTSEGANAVAEMASSAHSGGILDNIGSFFGDGGSMLSKGAGLISTLFGGKAGGIVDVVSNLAGVKSSSTNSLLSMVAPIALGALGKHAASNGLGASGIASLLSSSSSSWTSLLPSGLSSILGGLGIGGAASAVSNAVGGATSAVSNVVGGATSKVTNMASGAGNAVQDVAAAGGGLMKWLIPLLLAVGLAVGAWYLLKDGCGSKPTTPGATTTTSTTTGGTTASTVATVVKSTYDSVNNITVYDDGAKATLELPGGVKLDSVGANGFENQLVTFIKSGKIDTVNKKINWIDLSGVNFVSGNTTYVGKSASQVVNAGKILKAFPNAQIKIGGYTDKSGDAAKNVTLSQQRAEKVKADMIAAGAGAGQIVEAKGYGGEFATAATTDKPGMAKDRKVSVKVSKQ